MPNSRTMKTPLIFAAGLAMLTGCQTTTPSVTATEAAFCDVWGDTLFLPSRADTPETIERQNRAVRIHESVCG